MIKRMFSTRFLLVLIPIVVMSMCPNVQQFKLTTLRYRNGYVTVSGMFNVYYQEDVGFSYKPDNFFWFSLWWQHQAGNQSVRYGPLTLVWIRWQQLAVHPTYEKLRFTAVFKVELVGTQDPTSVVVQQIVQRMMG